ncbi:DeoR/GlpR family DNA-binding transcription regulator [Pseudomonas sp.]|uniref:DeoR/GlpR family DNA-binding transcription regulator n=1 Tax=Pseudomonas sp. TaxID=306 RepID=UPI0028A7006F|nr:DeoR/GlpR family DNA-binding transcription regulator [Pseudomonas sp.]
MKPRERRTLVLSFIEQRGQASVEQLVAEFGVSPETIRRDLWELAEEGRVQKIHGGARKLRGDREGSFQQRLSEGREVKLRIAERLAEVLAPGDTLFVDTGSTTLAAAPVLARIGGLTIFTNSLRIAGEIGERAEVYMLGGQFRQDNLQTVGPMAIEQISAFRADYALLTVGGLDAQAGAADFNAEEAQVARAMVANARQVIVIADASKCDRQAPFRVCGLERIDLLITDAVPDGALKAALAKAEVRVISA